MHKLTTIAALVAALSASCLADVADAPDKPTEGELGLNHGAGGISPEQAALRTWLITHTGPCARACLAVLAGACDWKQTCAVVDWVNCGVPVGTTLTCAEAQSAGRGWGPGLNDCYDSCAGASD
jgi:hypothetical protein